MSDIVERLNVYGRSEFGQSVPGFMFVEAATEIARLRAELAEARDKALDEALKVIGERQEFYSRKCEKERERQNYEQIITLGDIVIALNIAETNIRALKSPKPPIL